MECVWGVSPELNEIVLSEICKCAIVLTFYSGSSETWKEEGDLAEEVTLLQWLCFWILLFHVIQYDYVASSLCDEVNMIHLLLCTLGYDVLLG